MDNVSQKARSVRWDICYCSIYALCFWLATHQATHEVQKVIFYGQKDLKTEKHVVSAFNAQTHSSCHMSAARSNEVCARLQLNRY